MADQVALVATAKGLIVYELPELGNPQTKGIYFKGFSVTMVHCDERHGRWWVGLSHGHWGQKLHFSDDSGKNWTEAEVPTFGNHPLPDGNKAALRQIWCLTHGGHDRPEVLWMGTDPGGLFKSEDYGSTFQLVDSLWNHPSRKDGRQWLGAGTIYPFLHTILVDPTNSDHIYVAVSSAGFFESRDGGQSWNPKNNGLRALYLPNPHVEVGHDPHRLIMATSDPKIIWQQNHCGIFYTKDGGDNWTDASNPNGIPSYGFSIAADQDNPARAWVIPVESDERRIAPGLKLQVFKTEDFGSTWKSDSDGLPENDCFDIVLRQSFDLRNQKFLFGTTNGNLYFRDGMKSNWILLSHTLTKVNALTIING